MTALSIWKLFRDAAESWIDHNATRLAAAVAFYAILSVAPLLILSVAVAGLVFGEEAARGELMSQIRDLMGDEGAEVIQTALASAKKPSEGILATVIGAVTLLVGAAGVVGRRSRLRVSGVAESPGVERRGADAIDGPARFC